MTAGSSPEALALLLAYLRVQAAVIALPVFAERSLPVRVRVALAMALAPLFAGQIAPPQGSLMVLAAGEVALGLVLGLLVRLAASALTIAASAIATSTSLAQLFGAETEAVPHPIGNLMHLAGLALLMALGFPIFVADYLREGFALWPAGRFPAAAELAPHAIAVIADAFRLALVLASPFVLGGLLFQALSGVVNRVMPAFPVIFAAAPAAILLALVAAAALAVPILDAWADAVLGFAVPAPLP